MDNVLAVALFDLAVVAPPLAVVIGAMLLALPSRPKVVASTPTTAQAA
jgi:hypothetical protein